MSAWTVGDKVSVVQNRAGGQTTTHAKNVQITKVSKLFVTLETGEVFNTRTGYVRGAMRTKGIGRAHERRIELSK